MQRIEGEVPFPCKYFGERRGLRLLKNDISVGLYLCHHPNHSRTIIAECNSCKDVNSEITNSEIKLPINPPIRSLRTKPPTDSKIVPVPSIIKSADGVFIEINNLYKSCEAFLILSGPSFNLLDKSKLQNRGILTIGVNNSPSLFRPSLWIFGDPPSKFHQSIWYDPHILKFAPYSRRKNYFRIKRDSNQFEWSKIRIKDLPSVLFYERNCNFSPENWLWENSFNWGNDSNSSMKNGFPNVINTMFTALRFSFYVGIRKLYLLGCDFSMESGKPGYAFEQDRTLGAINNNNNSFLKMKGMLSKLKPIFDDNGFQVLNCNPKSKLEVFPYYDYDNAIESSIRGIPQELDTKGWYESDGNR